MNTTQELEPLKLRTLKKAHAETGASISFFKQLLRQGKLNRFKINSATYIDLREFENLAKQQSLNTCEK
jgi:hypothetical protein